MRCLHPVKVWYDAGDVKVPGPEVPCGRCAPCRKARAAEWAVRLYHERDYWSHSAFVTLTYNDEHLPDNQSLDKEELQRFFKRLRKRAGKPLKYFACGEYGEIYGRPHYHFIGFGLSLFDQALVDQAWGKGFVSIGTVTLESCRYVSNYVLKEQKGGLASKDYGNKIAPFRLSSQLLGARFLDDNRNQIISNCYITVHGTKMCVPRYYIKRLGDDVDQAKLNELTRERSESRESAFADDGVGPLEAWQRATELRVRKAREDEHHLVKSKNRRF